MHRFFFILFKRVSLTERSGVVTGRNKKCRVAAWSPLQGTPVNNPTALQPFYKRPSYGRISYRALGSGGKDFPFDRFFGDPQPLGSKRKPLRTTGFGLFFLLPIGFFGYPVFLTHSHLNHS